MWTIAFTFLAAAAISAVLTPIVRDAAIRRRLGQPSPSARSVHTAPIPRLGGVAIVVAFHLPLLAIALARPEVGAAFREDARLVLGLLAGGLAIAALGVYDDVRGADARLKLTVQLAVALAMYGLGYRIDAITSPWGGSLHLGWLGLPVTMLWIAGVVNAVNLIDGLDGLAGGVAFFAIATTFVTAFQEADALMLLSAAAMAGAVLGFLRYNFNPATVFMGDTGSMFLGFVLAVTAIHTHQKSSAAVAIAVPLIALGVPLADTALSIGRRALHGAPIFVADRGHIHHRLLDRGLTHRQAVLVLYGSGSTLAAAALALTLVNSAQGFLILLVLAVVGWVGLRTLGYFDLARTGQVLASRRRKLDMRAAVSRARARLRRAQAPLEVWLAVRAAAPGLGAGAVGLHLQHLAGQAATGPWSAGFDSPARNLLRARYLLDLKGLGEAHLELGWSDGRSQVERDTEVAVESLCDEASSALERLARHAPRPAAVVRPERRPPSSTAPPLARPARPAPSRWAGPG
jgi:UDP-GlcNAc:undecaprenyl-phosphate GlcNAc-1-phosphate transferase